MTGEVLLDTSVIIAHLRGDEAVTRRLMETEFLHVPVIAIGELHYGALKALETEEALRQIEEFLTAVSVLDTDRAAAQWYGRVKKGLAERGTPIPENDIWIAALAARHGLPLAHRDAHFRQIQEAGPELLQW